MFRTAATAALTAAGLLAVAPLASASEAPVVPSPVASATAGAPAPAATPRAPGEGGSGNVSLLGGLNVLPVQACGLQVPILSGVLAAPNSHCTQTPSNNLP